MKQKNRNIYLFSLMILTSFLISILYLANLKIVIILIIAAIPVSVYSIYFGIKDYHIFFLKETEKIEEKPKRVIDGGTQIRSLPPVHWAFPEFLFSQTTIHPTKTPLNFILITTGSTFEYFFEPEEKQTTQKSIKISFKQPKWYEDIILGNYATAQLAETLIL